MNRVTIAGIVVGFAASVLLFRQKGGMRMKCAMCESLIAGKPFCIDGHSFCSSDCAELHVAADGIEKAFANVGCARLFDIGDVVRYEGDLYIIDGLTFEASRVEGLAVEEIRYELSLVQPTGDWSDFADAYQDELTFVSKSTAKLSEILPKKEAPVMAVSWAKDNEKPPRKHREREDAEMKRRKDARVESDRLLDEYNAQMAAGDRAAAETTKQAWHVARVIAEAGGVGGKDESTAE